MGHDVRIAAVTVNHNSSHFVELLVRTLLFTNSFDDLDFSFTVLDNQSDDESLLDLIAYLHQQHIPFVQTGFDTAVAVEKHGAALEAFVQQHAKYTHYLFLDADIWFIQPNTIPTMLSELQTAEATVFANQAQIAGYYAGRIIEGQQQVPGASDIQTYPAWETVLNGRSYRTRGATRCSPVCSLIKNSSLFRTTVGTMGFTPALRLQVDTAIYYDTFGLMTHAMQVAKQRFMVSSQIVNHFTETTYQPLLRAPKDRDCLALLHDLRTGAGIQSEHFYESEWVKQQRSVQ